MKKKIVIFLVCFLFMLVFGIGFYCYQNDNIHFKLSYEYINYVEYDNGKKIKVSIPFDNRIQYLSENELIQFLENGTGILYFGYNTCPWCRNAVPILIDIIRKNNINTVYYADIHNMDISSIHDELYQKLEPYLRENENGNKVFAFPDVYFIKEGTIVGHHLGTVDSYHNPYKGMSDSEIEELKTIYQNLIEEMKLWTS